MQLSLTGTRALVGGSTQGIGLACAQALAEMGCRVTLLARDASRLKQAAGTLSQPQGDEQQHSFLIADFREPDSVRETVDTFVRETGPIQILINNTGGPKGGPILEAAADEFIQAARMHVVVSHLLVQTLVPGMQAARFGRIVNIISTSVKEPIPGLGVSNTIRGAMASWAKTLSRELAPHGITINNVLPGFTETARLQSLIATRAQTRGVTDDVVRDVMLAGVPMARFADASEIANVAAFLASPAASYVTGTSIPVDGGRTGSI